MTHWQYFIIVLLYLITPIVIHTILYVLGLIDDENTFMRFNNAEDIILGIVTIIFWPLITGLFVCVGICMLFKWFFTTIYPHTLRAGRAKINQQKIKLLAKKVRHQQKKQAKKHIVLDLPKWF